MPSPAEIAAARRLLADEVLARAFEQVRLDALVALGNVDPTDTKEIMRLQAIAGCLQEVRDNLITVIIASGEQDGGYVASEPTEH